MGIPTYAGLGTALSGLEAMQAGIDTTSQNISNASTPGYAQETVDLTDSASLRYASGSAGVGGFEVGTGVTLKSILRADDPYVDQQYWTQNGKSSYSSTVYTQLDDLQSNLDDSATTGISAQLSNFFSAWGSLGGSGGASTPSAQNVVSQGQTLAQMFNSLSAQLSTLQGQASSELTSLTDPSSGEVAQYANQIASLNTQIAAQTAAGLSPDTLEDQRSAAIDSLSALVGVTVVPQSNGADTIQIGGVTDPNTGTTGAVTLVDGSSSAVGDPTTAVTLPDTADYTAATGGQVGALVQLSSPTGSIATLSSALDSVAGEVATDVNNLLPSSTPFFTGTTASTIAVSSGATAASLVAVANAASVTPSDGTDPATTGGDLMNQLSGLSSSVTAAYGSFVDQVGEAVDSADNSNTTNQALLTSVADQRESVSGVSLDQEMTDLITYQQGYQASAKVMNTMQSVLQTLIQSVGGAGI